ATSPAITAIRVAACRRCRWKPASAPTWTRTVGNTPRKKRRNCNRCCAACSNPPWRSGASAAVPPGRASMPDVLVQERRQAPVQFHPVVRIVEAVALAWHHQRLRLAAGLAHRRLHRLELVEVGDL